MLVLTLFACRGGTLTIDDTATDDTGDVVEEPVPDFSAYEAQLEWTYDTWGDSYDCTDSTVEYATEITLEDDDYDALKDACPLCSNLYEITYDRAELCEWIDIPDPDFRGLVFGEGSAQVYRFDQRDEGFSEDLLDNAATWDGWTLTFSADVSYFGELNVVGTTTFPEVAE
jgi:hypothetical protein